MDLSRRLILLVCGVLIAAVAVTGGVFAYGAHGALLERALADGRHVAELAARSTALVREVPRAAEELLSAQIVAQASLAAELVAMGEAARQPARVINDRLRAAADAGAIEEIVATDQRGRIVYRSRPVADVAYGADAAPSEQPFTTLLKGSTTPVVRPAQRLEAGGPVIKPAAVAGADKPRVVRVDADVTGLAELARRAGVERVIDELLASRMVEAVWLLAPDQRVLAHGAVTGIRAAGAPAPDADELAAARSASGGRKAAAVLAGPWVLAAAPVTLSNNEPFATLLVRMPAGDLDGGWRTPALVAGVVTLLLLILAVGRIAATVGGRLDEPLDRLAEAASALHVGRFNPFTLNDLCDRDDAAARAARAFRAMAVEVTQREEHLEALLQSARGEPEEEPAPEPEGAPADEEYRDGQGV
ncbi:hypothetical protein HL658_16625 [Azospirillum sp. RWY-5-1]|uniref:HAMP domain-containing protein n=1 Tax=Azospirillum oleiclasticum TaxID=2735135 RepID=A0ABX2TEE6_9PROT|nr:hypothetical protein [Azospirillum oleiclasticum]NYZ14182.1 hypothetical protein [Azospirillum oleiclasticum]NYZ21666.1 hypothetical protein [Azospirillum oleiclasticum]